MAAPAARAPRRDALAEQQLVRDLWQQVEAHLDSSGVLRAFLTQKIDDCGQTVAFEAFDLVRQVLNPDGFVRRAHKSADQNLGAAITMPESPWTAEGSVVDRQWDFNNYTFLSEQKYIFSNLCIQLIPAYMRLRISNPDILISLLVQRFVIRKSKSGNVIRSLMYPGIRCTRV